MDLCEKISYSVGKKFLMAVSGLILFLFVLGHLAGNLMIYGGPDMLNGYAKKLLSLGPGLWAARIFLISMVFLHIITSVKLTLENKAARPVAYSRRPVYEETTYAARTMMASGIIIVAFLIYHLLHFTFRLTNPDISHMKDTLGRHNVYAMVILSFKNIYISMAYIAAMIPLCMHLSHGIASLFQSLGFNDEKTIPVFKFGSRLVALAIFIGYVSIPLSVLMGRLHWVK